MEFFINKGATLPIIKMELIRDGRNDFRKFFEKIQNANIYFTMTDSNTGIKKIGKNMASTQLVEPVSDCYDEEYYIIYQLSSLDTSKIGRFIGEFTIEFQDGSGTLLVPIRDTLYINILDHNIKK